MPIIAAASSRLKQQLARDIAAKAQQQLMDGQDDAACCRSAVQLHARAVLLAREAAVDAQQAGAVLLQAAAQQQVAQLLVSQPCSVLAQLPQQSLSAAPLQEKAAALEAIACLQVGCTGIRPSLPGWQLAGVQRKCMLPMMYASGRKSDVVQHSPTFSSTADWKCIEASCMYLPVGHSCTASARPMFHCRLEICPSLLEHFLERCQTTACHLPIAQAAQAALAAVPSFDHGFPAAEATLTSPLQQGIQAQAGVHAAPSGHYPTAHMAVSVLTELSQVELLISRSQLRDGQAIQPSAEPDFPRVDGRDPRAVIAFLTAGASSVTDQVGEKRWLKGQVHAGFV